MNVVLAESAGFCFGVDRAVSLTRKALAEHGSCWISVPQVAGLPNSSITQAAFPQSWNSCAACFIWTP